MNALFRLIFFTGSFVELIIPPPMGSEIFINKNFANKEILCQKTKADKKPIKKTYILKFIPFCNLKYISMHVSSH